jgi:hypothetical protein
LVVLAHLALDCDGFQFLREFQSKFTPFHGD